MGQKKISRRDFISQSSVGIASFAILKNRGESLASLPETGDGDIIYRELGKTGIQIPIVPQTAFRRGLSDPEVS